MQERGRWALAKCQNPTGLHISLTLANCVYWKEICDDINKCIEEMKKNPSLNHTSDAAAYGIASKIPDEKVIKDIVYILNECLFEVV